MSDQLLFWQTSAAVVGVVLMLALAAITAYYAWQTRQQVEASNRSIEEMRRLREAQARAYVTVEVWPWDRRLWLFDMAIRNYGSGAARDIQIVFEPDVRQPQYSEGTLSQLEIMRDLPFLAPHDEVLFFLGTQKWIKVADLPEVWEGTVQYTDDVGRHQTKFRINLKQWDRLQPMLPQGGPSLALPLRRGWAPVRQWDEPPSPPRAVWAWSPGAREGDKGGQGS